MRAAVRLMTWAVIPLLVFACARDLAAPTAAARSGPWAHDECIPQPNEIQPCGDAGSGGGIGSWPYFGPLDDGIHPALNDPSSTSAGIWLGDTISPHTCFADYAVGSAFTDADKDWLSDRCEAALAYAFAPVLQFSGLEQCPGGEPYWAAKYFPTPGVVRIAYLPAYYVDCGPDGSLFPPTYSSGHFGDSEFMSVEVAFNPVTHHWEFRRMWLSAHYGGATDHSGWVSAPGTIFPYHPLTRPLVFVSADKHGNYASLDACSWEIGPGVYHETCDQGAYLVRMPTKSTHNLGSPFGPKGCVAAEYAGLANDGRLECFYTPRSGECFAGWIAVQCDAPIPTSTPYIVYLNSDKFEVFNDNAVNDHGPGPNPPTFSVSISGPNAPTSATYATWTAQPTYGFPAYSVSWYEDGVFVGTGTSFSDLMGDAGTIFTLTATATDSHGNVTSASLQVVVTDAGGGLQPGGGF